MTRCFVVVDPKETVVHIPSWYEVVFNEALGREGNPLRYLMEKSKFYLSHVTDLEVL
jgi:hypothetical protein